MSPKCGAEERRFDPQCLRVTLGIGQSVLNPKSLGPQKRPRYEQGNKMAIHFNLVGHVKIIESE